MSIDSVKMAKVETILAALTPAEQDRVRDFLLKLRGTPVAPPVTTPASNPKTFRDLEQEAMALFNYGDTVEFTSKHGAVVRGMVVRKNARTLGLDNRWRVSPQLCRKVEPVEATPMPVASPTIPLRAGAGVW